MRKPVMERHIDKTVISILRERLVELETLKATGAATEDTVRRLAFVRKLRVQFDATASRAFSSEVGTGSRQENAMKLLSDFAESESTRDHDDFGLN
jgi:hypothetical protein